MFELIVYEQDRDKILYIKYKIYLSRLSARETHKL